MSKLVDDLGHIAWVVLGGVAFFYLPWYLAAPLAALPREIEQAVAAKKKRNVFSGYRRPKTVPWTWRDHLSRTSFWWGKIRDLGGFAIGGWLLEVLLG